MDEKTKVGTDEEQETATDTGAETGEHTETHKAQEENPEMPETAAADGTQAEGAAAAEGATTDGVKPTEAETNGKELGNDDADGGTPTVESLSTALADSQKQLLQAQAQIEALKLGIPEERIPFALNMAGVSSMDAAAEDALGMLTRELQKAVDAVPGLAESAGGTGSAGNFARQKQPTAQDQAEALFNQGLQGGGL